MAKNLPIRLEMQVQSLGQEEPGIFLEEETATSSSVLVWRIPWTEATVYGVTKSWIQPSDYITTTKVESTGLVAFSENAHLAPPLKHDVRLGFRCIQDLSLLSVIKWIVVVEVLLLF